MFCKKQEDAGSEHPTWKAGEEPVVAISTHCLLTMDTKTLNQTQLTSHSNYCVWIMDYLAILWGLTCM